MPVAAIEAPLKRLTLVLVGCTLFVFISSTAFAAQIARSITGPLGHLANAALRLGRGEQVPTLRTHMREADDVARALTLAGSEILARGAALAASDERFRAAVRAVAGVVWTNDAAGRMPRDQPGWAALTGQTPDEYEGYGWSKAIHPDDVEPTLRAWNDAVRQGCTFVFEHRVRRHDGVYRRFSIRGVPVLDEAGGIREWVGVHTDITDEYEANRQLAESQAELRELNATLEQRVDRDGGRARPDLAYLPRIDAGRRARRRHDRRQSGLAGNAGLDAEELPGGASSTWCTRTTSNARWRSLRAWRRAFRPLRFENRFRHRDGSYRWISWTAVPEPGLIHCHRPRHHRREGGGRGVATDRGAAAPVAEDGGGRPAHRRRRARLQQPADRRSSAISRWRKRRIERSAEPRGSPATRQRDRGRAAGGRR